MELLSVNVSLPKVVQHDGETVTTGIFKKPVAGRVVVRRLNLDGDRQADLENHGGVYKAVYAYPAENYDLWGVELGRDDLAPGQFGENFTVAGITEETVHVGDVLRIGGAVVQVVQPRTPCYKLGMKMGSAEFPKRFLASGRVGFYLRVLEEGEVGAGDAIERLQIDPERMTVREISDLLHFDLRNLEGTRRALRIAALAPGRRRVLQARLAKAGTEEVKR